CGGKLCESIYPHSAGGICLPLILAAEKISGSARRERKQRPAGNKNAEDLWFTCLAQQKPRWSQKRISAFLGANNDVDFGVSLGVSFKDCSTMYRQLGQLVDAAGACWKE